MESRDDDEGQFMENRNNAQHAQPFMLPRSAQLGSTPVFGAITRSGASRDLQPSNSLFGGLSQSSDGMQQRLPSAVNPGTGGPVTSGVTSRALFGDVTSTATSASFSDNATTSEFASSSTSSTTLPSNSLFGGLPPPKDSAPQTISVSESASFMPTTVVPTGNVFGGAGSVSTSGSSGNHLFGGISSTQAGTSNNVFKATDTTSMTANSSNLFGGVTSASNTTTSNLLFGGSGSITTGVTAVNPVFGGTSSTTKTNVFGGSGNAGAIPTSSNPLVFSVTESTPECVSLKVPKSTVHGTESAHQSSSSVSLPLIVCKAPSAFVSSTGSAVAGSSSSGKLHPSGPPNIFGGIANNPFSTPTALFGGVTDSASTKMTSKLNETPEVDTTEDAKDRRQALKESHTADGVSPIKESTIFGGNPDSSLDQFKGSESGTSSNDFGGGAGASSVPVPVGSKIGVAVSSESSLSLKKSVPASVAAVSDTRVSSKNDNKKKNDNTSQTASIFGAPPPVSSRSRDKSSHSDKTSVFSRETDNSKNEGGSSSESKTSTESLIDSVLKSEGKGDLVQNTGTTPEYDKKELTKIIVVQIPDLCMDRAILKNHFEKFGDVKRVTLNPKVNQATVQYLNYRGASKAKKKGTKIHPKLPEVKIFYGTPARRKSEEGSTDAVISKRRAIKTLQQGHSSTDLDPYIPLERNSDSLPKASKRLSDRTISKKSTSDVYSQGSDSLKKSSFSAAPTRRPLLRPESPLRAASPFKMESPKRTASPLREKDSISTARDEPKTSAASKDSKTASASNRELLEIQAQSNHDKYNILKARDKLIRSKLTRPSDLKKAAFLAATCPDMCPEKERYMRDVQNDISSYEMTNGLLDHRRAIKKFSRSSADKDEPLPHELRPGPVLLITMNYLICNIIDKGDTEGLDLDVWYNYLWNRTRAIRNDLMQQQLTDSVAVVIMEKCVRFHIYAAERLCEEPPDIFDSKMNTEHLTKSLQTLKELYKDLGERNEYFGNEPEFRAYEMLLNLNKGEIIINQYSQFREEVQKSSDVQFALKVALSLMDNNYIKFFKLIREATYLQGCVLHRYFQQVRSKALDTMMKVYNPVKQCQTMPLQAVVNFLGFETDRDAIAYLACHKIKVDNQNVVLDKSSFISNPEEKRPQLVRPINLVESNRIYSIGETVQGGPLPDNPLDLYKPHDSFNEEGYLKPEAKDASDQTEKEIQALPEVLKQDKSTMDIVKKLPDKELESKSEETCDMFLDGAIKEMLAMIGTDAIKMVEHEMASEKATSDNIISEVVQAEIADVSSESHKEVEKEEKEKLRKLKEEEEKRQKARAEERVRVISILYHEHYSHFLHGIITEVVQESLDDVEAEVRQKAFDDLVRELPEDISDVVVIEESKKISQEVITQMTQELLEKLRELYHKSVLRSMREHFRKWHLQVIKAKRRKYAQVDFPASCSQLSIHEQNEAFAWGYQRNIRNNMSYCQLAEFEHSVQKISDERSLKNQFLHEQAWLPLNLQYHLQTHLMKREEVSFLLRRYFKLLICTTNATIPGSIQWLRSKLRSDETGDITKPLNESFNFVSKHFGLEHAFVIRETPVEVMSDGDIKGTSAVIFVISMNEDNVSKTNMQNVRDSLPNVPASTILFGKESSDPSVWSVLEDDLLRSDTSDYLKNLITDLWNQHSQRVQLTSAPMNNFVYGFIANKFVQTVLCTQNERIVDGKSPISPSVQIDLYNKIIDFLIQVVSDESFKSLMWPPSELSHLRQIPLPTWNTTDGEKVTCILKNLKIPSFDISGIMTWEKITEALHDYVMRLCSPQCSDIVLISRLNSLLSNSLKILRATDNFENLNNEEFHVLQLPWSELIYVCIEYKFSGLPDIPMYFQPKKLKNLSFPSSWWSACDSSDPTWGEAAKLDAIPPESRKRKATNEDDVSKEIGKVKRKESKILSDLQTEKQKCDDFEKKLEKELELDEELRSLFKYDC